MEPGQSSSNDKIVYSASNYITPSFSVKKGFIFYQLPLPFTYRCKTAKTICMRTNKPFEKFIKPEFKGAKKKEAIRQQKRKLKAEARAAGDEARKRKWEQVRGIEHKEEGSKNKTQVTIYKSKVTDHNARTDGRTGYQKPVSGNRKPETDEAAELMPLNKFVAYCGVCGRREAAELIKKGFVTVNGDTIFEPGYKVRGNEDIKVKGKKIFLQRNLVYILLNKPKDYITTAKDPEGRKTVFDLLKHATPERIYPVGRLDRNTTGVLLLTNDGELAQKLTHPSFEVKKIYEVKLDKPLAKSDFDALTTGLQLEDGFVKADNVGYADAKDKSIIGIEIHSGKNRIVRRMFEHLGYDVRNLDRVMFANLTKKNVDRGKWRMLQEKEVRLLKYLNQSFTKSKKAEKTI